MMRFRFRRLSAKAAKVIFRIKIHFQCTVRPGDNQEYAIFAELAETHKHAGVDIILYIIAKLHSWMPVQARV
jgi:hypothetical protein